MSLMMGNVNPNNLDQPWEEWDELKLSTRRHPSVKGNTMGEMVTPWDEKQENLTSQRCEERRVSDASVEQNSFGDQTYKHTEKFLEVMEAYQEVSQDPSTRALNLRGRHNWSEVLDEARRCEARYIQAGSRGPRKIARSLSAQAEVMQPWFRLIPNDMFLAVLSGGLKLIFNAATRINEMREDAINQLLRIPEVIAYAESCCKNFGRDEELFAYAEHLYLAALAAIEGMMEWLQQRTSKRQLRSLLRGPLYNKPFQDKIQALDAALSSMQQHVSTLRDRSIRRTETAVHETKDVMQNVKSALHDLSQAEPGNRKRIDDALEEMKEMLADRTRTAQWMNKKDVEVSKLKSQVRHMQMSRGLSHSDLLDILDVQKTHPECDIRRILRRAQSDETAGEIALGVTKGPKFSKWHVQDENGALFIESSISSSDEVISCTSLISSYFIESVKQHSICVYFFCGRHEKSIDRTPDTLVGPLGMMRSLIAQTIRLSAVKIDFIPPYLQSNLENLDFRALCTCFTLIIENLPPGTVLFCVIDGINSFERIGWLEDCTKAIYDLQDLTYNYDMDATFKLLVTCPARSRKVGDIFKPEQRLLLDNAAWNNKDGRDFPTDREIMDGSRRPSVQQRLRRSLRDQRRDEWSEDVGESVDAFPLPVGH